MAKIVKMNPHYKEPDEYLAPNKETLYDLVNLYNNSAVNNLMEFDYKGNTRSLKDWGYLIEYIADLLGVKVQIIANIGIKIK
jgi:hypothetical protein